MGFLDSLFGSGKQKAPAAKPGKSIKAKATPAAVPAADGIPPEVLAAISASVGIAMEGASAELIAAVTATIAHALGGAKAVRFKRTSGAWVAAGRQKIMDSRQYV